MNVLDHANELRHQAIQLLLAERTNIDNALKTLSADGTEQATEIKKAAPRKCGNCGGENHNTKTCKVIPTGTTL